jgi:hypothetical protein
MRLLFGLLLFGVNTSGQNIIFPKDSSVISIVGDLPSTEPFDTSRAYQKRKQRYVYILSGKDVYEIFGYSVSDKYQNFNFKDYHILGQQVTNKWTWQLRENKKAFVEVPSTTKFGWVGFRLANGTTSYLKDSLMQLISDSVQWATEGRGDCKAHFNYSVVRDKYYPTLLLIERNYWGGCRAGGSKAYTISFVMPRNILQYSKNTILMNKYRDQPEE